MQSLEQHHLTELAGRYKKWIWAAIIIFVAILLTFVIFKIVRAFKKPANATYVQGGGAIPVGWDPTQMTDKLFKLIDGVLVSTDTMQEVFGDFNKLNDNQMIEVYNKWLDKDYNDVKKYFIYPLGTLTQAIKDKIGYAAFGTNQKTLAEINLDRLHLE